MEGFRGLSYGLAKVREEPVRMHRYGSVPERPGYASAREVVAALAPVEPVYCIYPHVVRRVARRFVSRFPGRVLYAVKANSNPRMLELLHASGVQHFDAASVPEIALVRAVCPEAVCYFMAPVKLRGAARAAYDEYGVRRFVLDHADELRTLLQAIPERDVTLFVRLETHGAGSTYDLSTKFGAPPEVCVELLRAVSGSGATPALAFNVGSLVREPGAYRQALAVCRQVLEAADVEVRELDMGGGFPSAYPDVGAPGLERFFEAIAAGRRELDLPASTELLGEPGRALVAEGVSLITQVLLRKDDRLYLNDGIYGSLLEPVISRGLVRFPTRTYRSGGEPASETHPFTLYGPTCDSLDVLPKPFPLPADIRAGDWVEFGMLGAYGQSMRTHFNGFFPDAVVEIDDPEALPPGVSVSADR